MLCIFVTNSIADLELKQANPTQQLAQINRLMVLFCDHAGTWRSG